MMLARIAPKIAVPNAAPIVRKNVIPDVATPSSPMGHGVLRREHEHLDEAAEPGAEDDHVPPT